MVPARAVGAPGRDGGGLHLGPRCVRVGQQLLLGRSAGRVEQLEGVLLRVFRRVQRDHRRQTAGVAVGDGVGGPRVRGHQLVDPGAAGAHGCWIGRFGDDVGQALVPSRGRIARRSCGRSHAGRCADVPVQQPRCAAGAAAVCGGLRGDPSDRVRRWLMALVGVGRDVRRLRLPVQDAAGVRGPTSVRAGVLRGGVDELLASFPRSRRARRHSMLAAGWWVAIVELWPPTVGRTSAGRRTTACSN